MGEWFLIVIALLLVGLSGVFVAAEFALITVSRPSAERRAAHGDRRSKGVIKALKNLSTQLSGAQVGITLTNLAIGFLAEPAIAHLFRRPLEAIGVEGFAITDISVVAGVLLATVVTMVFGELVPKNIAIARPLATARAVQRFQRYFSKAMAWPIRLLNGSANFLLQRVGLEAQEELASARSADELSSLVRRSAEKGTLPEQTAQMLERSLAFRELTALDVMTPRIRVRTVGIHDSAADIIALAQRTGLSRFPVVKNGLDEVVGIVHIKRAVAVAEEDRAKKTAEQLMQPALIVPSSLELEPLLQKLRHGGLQMAVIIDEFGGADGVVTIEDLIEELVGEVQDEHDRMGRSIRARHDGSWGISGLLRPDEIGQTLGIFLPEEEEFETIGGLVADRLEHVPQTNESVIISAVDREGQAVQVHLTVERMDGRRVDRVHMRVLADDADMTAVENA